MSIELARPSYKTFGKLGCMQYLPSPTLSSASHEKIQIAASAAIAMTAASSAVIITFLANKQIASLSFLFIANPLLCVTSVLISTLFVYAIARITGTVLIPHIIQQSALKDFTSLYENDKTQTNSSPAEISNEKQIIINSISKKVRFKNLLELGFNHAIPTASVLILLQCLSTLNPPLALGAAAVSSIAGICFLAKAVPDSVEGATFTKAYRFTIENKIDSNLRPKIFNIFSSSLQTKEKNHRSFIENIKATLSPTEVRENFNALCLLGFDEFMDAKKDRHGRTLLLRGLLDFALSDEISDKTSNDTKINFNTSFDIIQGIIETHVSLLNSRLSSPESLEGVFGPLDKEKENRRLLVFKRCFLDSSAAEINPVFSEINRLQSLLNT